MVTGLVLAALMKVVRFYHPPVGLILHSDRGSQYCNAAYQKKFRAYGLVCSKSKKGDCYDNAQMESFWGLLKNEALPGFPWVADLLMSFPEGTNEGYGPIFSDSRADRALVC